MLAQEQRTRRPGSAVKNLKSADVCAVVIWARATYRNGDS